MSNEDVLKRKEKIELALKATTNTLAFLNLRLMQGPPLPEAAALNAQIARAQGELTHLSLLKANLDAGVGVVTPLSAEAQNRLDVLAAQLDQAIRDDFVLNATLVLAKKALQTGEDIGEIIGGHA